MHALIRNTSTLKDGNTVAVFIGVQQGYKHIPDLPLFNLTQPVGIHPAGSTVGTETLKKYGYGCPTIPSTLLANNALPTHPLPLRPRPALDTH